MKISATIGNESHSTSSGWAKVSVNGRQLSHRDAVSKEFQTKYGDKHAMWVECVFNVNSGDKISWEAGANSGSRGSDQTRQNLEFIADESVDVIETPAIGYPASNAKLRGRLRQVEDRKADSHAAMMADL